MTFDYNWSGGFSNPSGLVLGNDGNVYVLNRGSGIVQVFSQQGAYLREFSAVVGWGMLQGLNGNLYITSGTQVKVFDTQGNAVTTFGSFALATGESFDAAGNLYVADYSNNLVAEFQSDGTPVTQFGVGELSRPEAVAVDASGNVYAWQFGNQQVKAFRPDGTLLTSWNTPAAEVTSMKFDPQGFLWLSPYNAGVLWVYDTAGNLLETIGSPGSGPGQFSGPWGIAFDGSGGFFLAELSNNRVDRFRHCGTVPTATATMTTGPSPCATLGYSWTGGMSSPGGVARGADGFIYVLNRGSGIVQVFTQTGMLDRQFETGAGWGMLQGLDGNLYITTSTQVKVFDTQGNAVTTIGPFGGATGEAFDNAGNIYVADYTYHRVMEYSSNGTFVRQFGSGVPGTFLNQLSHPESVAVDASGKVYVWESGTKRIQVFAPDGTALWFWSAPSTEVVEMHFDAQGFLWLSDWQGNALQVYDVNGNLRETFSVVSPWGLAFDGSGGFFVAEYSANRIDRYLNCGAPTPTPTPSPTPVAGAYVLRLDAGSAQDYEDQAGDLWLADRVYAAGSFGYVQGGQAVTNLGAVSGTPDPLLYQTYRHDPALSYQADLPAPGTYQVTLKFVDFISASGGQNVFDVLAQSQVVIAGLDVFSAAGPSAAYDRSFPVTVASGGGSNSLSLQFNATAGQAFVSAIKVEGQQSHPNPLFIYLVRPGGGALLP